MNPPECPDIVVARPSAESWYKFAHPFPLQTFSADGLMVKTFKPEIPILPLTKIVK
jgi:hypothetical protein